VVLTAERLTKRYGRLTAVDDVSFDVRPGVVTGFLGPNGAGKTTMLAMLAGLVRPTSGRVLLGGTPLRERSPEARTLADRAIAAQEETEGRLADVTCQLAEMNLRVAAMERVFKDAE
jgi:ABC-type multidrug transport system ATPase subunit